jgi:hypothetical protein
MLNGTDSESKPTENLLTTNNTKLAAILMVFGGKLYNSPPLEWCDLYESKESFFAGEKPKRCVSFNFYPTIDFRNIVDAYNDPKAEQRFIDSLEGLDEGKKQKILVAHSGSIARTCRECLEHRKFLLELLNSVPNEAKWEQIKGQNKQMVRFGKNSSAKLKDEFLSKLD